MPIKEKIKHIVAELKGHAPFTCLGALAGIFFMLIFKTAGKPSAATLFSIFHPGHVLLSAMVTASIFSLHRKRKNLALILIVGYVGSIGVATLSDSIIPYLGESIFGLRIPTHIDLHSYEQDESHDDHVDEDTEHQEHRIHLGFIEDWYIVNPAALLGILIAYFVPRTKFPHAGHVLISTWASSAHILMNITGEITLPVVMAIFVILFVAVWLPCCISDIIFPLLFVKSDLELAGLCPNHKKHSHEHVHKDSEG